MAQKLFVLACGLIIAGAPLSATQPDSGPLEASPASPPVATAPPGTPGTRYCMRIELTGNIVEPVRCWTRDQWAEQGVDVDREWAKEGIKVVEPVTLV